MAVAMTTGIGLGNRRSARDQGKLGGDPVNEGKNLSIIGGTDLTNDGGALY
jgi:hypothetical protein